jgi:glutamate-ammonia-ligase adenylyltransferase
LGTLEFDVLSDADLLFVRSDDLGSEQAAAIAEGVIHALAAYTREGMVFPVDARLRPHGGEGELVITAEQLSSYLWQEGQAWEALTFTKLRAVAGSESIANQALASARASSKRFAADAEFARQVRQMRARLEATGDSNFKTGRGGIYDIDFLASYLLIRTGETAALNLDDRLRRLCEIGALDPEDASTLAHHARFLRTVEHAVRLVTGVLRETLPASEHTCTVVERLVDRMLPTRVRGDLHSEIEHARGNVRGLYERLLQ